jgi:hypothetical protein
MSANFSLSTPNMFLPKLVADKSEYSLAVVLEDNVDKQGTLTTETTFRTSWTLLELEHEASARRIATNRFW